MSCEVLVDAVAEVAVADVNYRLDIDKMVFMLGGFCFVCFLACLFVCEFILGAGWLFALLLHRLLCFLACLLVSLVCSRTSTCVLKLCSVIFFSVSSLSFYWCCLTLAPVFTMDSRVSGGSTLLLSVVCICHCWMVTNSVDT